MTHAPAPWGAPALFGGDLNITPGAPRFQSETTIAVKGDTIVVGFNDANGFLNPNGVSVSGFAYSHDGGASFTYGGQLPLAGGGDMVRGDPGVQRLGEPARRARQPSSTARSIAPPPASRASASTSPPTAA